jgi:hypothetical protein
VAIMSGIGLIAWTAAIWLVIFFAAITVLCIVHERQV